MIPWTEEPPGSLSLSKKSMYKKLSDEEMEGCPICEIDLGCVPSERLRADHKLQDVRAKKVPPEQVKVKAPEVVTSVSLSAQGKERSTSSLVVSTPRLSTQDGTMGRRSKSITRKASRESSFTIEKFVVNSIENQPEGSSSQEMLHKFTQSNRQHSSVGEPSNCSPDKEREKGFDNWKGKLDLWKSLTCLVAATNRSKYSKFNFLFRTAFYIHSAHRICFLKLGCMSKNRTWNKLYENYEKTTNFFQSEEVSAAANQCKQKVAQFVAQLEQDQKVIEIHEEIAQQTFNNTLLKYRVEGHLLNVGICQLCKADFVAIDKELKRYQSLVPGTHEYILLADLATAIEEKCMTKFTDAVKEYESITQLDACKFITFRKFFLAYRTTSDIPRIFLLLSVQSVLSLVLYYRILEQPKFGGCDCAYILKASAYLGQYGISIVAGGVNYLSLVFTSCFQNKFTNFMSVCLSSGCIVLEWILAWHIRVHNSLLEVSILFDALRNMGLSNSCAAANIVSELFDGGGCWLVKHHLLEENIVSPQILFFMCGIITSACGGKVFEGVFVGVFLSMSSTTVVYKFLMEKSSTKALHGQVIIGTVILQDCAVRMLFIMLPVLGWTSNVMQGKISMIKSLLVWIAFLKPITSLSSQINEHYQLVSVAYRLFVACCRDKLGLSLKLGSFAAKVMVARVIGRANDTAPMLCSFSDPLMQVAAFKDTLLQVTYLLHKQRDNHHLEDKVALEAWGNDTTVNSKVNIYPKSPHNPREKMIWIHPNWKDSIIPAQYQSCFVSLATEKFSAKLGIYAVR